MTTDNDRAPQPTEAPSKGEVAEEVAGRKPYTTPRLTVYGPVEAITGLVGTNPIDGFLGSQF